MEAPLGSNVVLEIETSQPVKQVKWYRNGESVPNKAKPKDVGNNVYQLEIPNVDADDTANFKVVVVGDDGTQDESSCALTVKLPTATKPGFEKGLEDKAVPVDKPLELEVKTFGSPTDVKWFKNGSPLSADGRIQLIKVDDNTFRLVIPKATLDDTGMQKFLNTSNILF
jgi:membrane carboxypeptidase/penicillin-binding protein PbpC